MALGGRYEFWVVDKVGELQAQSGFPEPGGLEKNFTKNLIYSQMGNKLNI